MRKQPPQASSTPPYSCEMPNGLTQRETEILQWFVNTGDSDRAIAQKFSISADTVHRHFKNIFTKLEVRNRATAIVWAWKTGFAEKKSMLGSTPENRVFGIYEGKENALFPL